MRALHSHDAVLMATLAEALAIEEAPASRTRCPMLPIVHRPTVDGSSPGMRFASALQILLADQWAADRAVERPLWRGARWLLSGAVGRAWEEMNRLGVGLHELRGFEGRQEKAESRARAAADPLSVAAAPTVRALGLGFAALAQLPGGQSQAAPALKALGEAVGFCIYTIDALDDLREDVQRGDFNPLVGDADHTRTRARLFGALDRVQAVLEELPLQRHRSLLDEVLVRSLRRRAELAIRRTEQAAGARRLAFWGLLGARLAALWLFVGALFSLARPARAAGGPQASMGCSQMPNPADNEPAEGAYHLDDCLGDWFCGLPRRVGESVGVCWEGTKPHLHDLKEVWTDGQHGLGEIARATCWTEPGHVLRDGVGMGVATVTCPPSTGSYCCGPECNPGFCSDFCTCCCSDEGASCQV